MARKVAVAFNDDAQLKTHLNETELLAEKEVADTAGEIAELLGAELVPVRGDILGALRTLRTFDAVVNLCEGVLGNPRLEKNFALGLEMLGIAHTSCDPIAVGLCTDKSLTKRILAAGDLPVPRLFDGSERTWIVKPSLEDAGIGIEPASIVETRDVAARVEHVEQTYRQPALVEEFIDGRELNQALYCGTILPPGEVVFAADMQPRERVVGWKAKWDSGSREDLGTANRTPALVDDGLKSAIAELCTRAAALLGIDMYARFDLRERGGELYIVDVNPNCDLGRGTGFRKALDAAGIAFRDFLDTLIMAAIARRSR